MNKKYTFYLEITTHCNMSCPFCPSTTNSTNFNMDYDDIISIINKIKKNIKLLYFHVLGEPLLHPDFNKIIEYCNNEGITFALTTNGTYLNEFKIKLLNKDNLSKINISLQSLIQYSQEKLENYLNNLKDFLEYRNNINSIVPINLRLWNDKNDSNILIMNNYIRDSLLFYVNNHRNVRFSEADEFDWPNINNASNEQFSNCLGGKKQFSILHDGSICLCCLDYQGKTKLGNILLDEFDSIIESKIYHDVIDGFNNRKPFFQLCKNCTFRNRFK